MRKFWLTILMILFPVMVLAEKKPSTIPVTLDGHPGLRFTEGRTYSTVLMAGNTFDPVFMIPFNRHHGLLFTHGHLSISAHSVHWQSDNGSETFDAPFSALSESKYSLWVDNGGVREVFYISVDGGSAANNNKDLRTFLKSLTPGFSDAVAAFTAMRGSMPAQISPAIDDDFRAQAAAWRALPTKPEMPEEVRKQRVLAESYLREKDFKGAIEHYEAGLKIDPTWPEGWFNLALLYGETGDYALAADRMRHYLELKPDAPDAQSARDKIVIWEDKATHK